VRLAAASEAVQLKLDAEWVILSACNTAAPDGNRVRRVYRVLPRPPSSMPAGGPCWYRKAAEQDVARAQTNLGVMYYFGKSVPVNNVKAYMWWSLTMAQGKESATKNLNIVKEDMNSAYISKAQALASEMLEKIND